MYFVNSSYNSQIYRIWVSNKNFTKYSPIRLLRGTRATRNGRNLPTDWLADTGVGEARSHCQTVLRKYYTVPKSVTMMRVWVRYLLIASGEESVILFPRYAYLHTAIGPLIFAPLGELYGRSRVLQLANMFYLGMYLLRRAYATFLLIGLFSMEPSLWFCKKRNTVDHFSIFGWNRRQCAPRCLYQPFLYILYL